MEDNINPDNFKEFEIDPIEDRNIEIPQEDDRFPTNDSSRFILWDDFY